MNALGRTIRAARLAKQLTQRQLARASGLKTSQISGLETGALRRFASPRTAVRMAKRLDLPPLVLLELGRPDFAIWQAAFGLKPKERDEA